MDDRDSLARQVTLITGASRGIGLAIARRLGQMGARVSICGRDRDRLDQAASALRSEGIETLATQTDVARAAKFRRWLRRRSGSWDPSTFW